MAKNYNYVFVFYDMNVDRVHKAFKICKKYLVHYQKSIFRGSITPANLIKLRNELKNIVEPTEDYICILKMISDNVFDEETLGGKPETAENLFL